MASRGFEHFDIEMFKSHADEVLKFQCFFGYIFSSVSMTFKRPFLSWALGGLPRVWAQEEICICWFFLGYLGRSKQQRQTAVKPRVQMSGFEHIFNSAELEFYHLQVSWGAENSVTHTHRSGALMDRRSDEDPPPFSVLYARVWNRTASLKSKNLLWITLFSPYKNRRYVFLLFFFSFSPLPHK